MRIAKQLKYIRQRCGIHTVDVFVPCLEHANSIATSLETWNWGEHRDVSLVYKGKKFLLYSTTLGGCLSRDVVYITDERPLWNCWITSVDIKVQCKEQTRSRWSRNLAFLCTQLFFCLLQVYTWKPDLCLCDFSVWVTSTLLVHLLITTRLQS